METMSRFLLLVSDREFDVVLALELCRELLAIETTNQLLKRYETLFVTLLGDGIVVYNAEEEETSGSEDEVEEEKSTSASSELSSASETEDMTPA